MRRREYVLEDTSEGRVMGLTGRWSRQTEDALARGEADGLVLNYARGFCEANLEFLTRDWSVRRLDLLDRKIVDLEPIGRLGGSLEELSVQADPRSEIDLAALPHLRSVAGEWGLIRLTLDAVQALQEVVTWRFDETDLRAFGNHFALMRLTLKEAAYLDSLSGLAHLTRLEKLSIQMARKLHDISDLAELASLRELKFEDCPDIADLNDVEQLVNLRVLSFSDCGDVASLGPVRNLDGLEEFYAWGSTRIVDGDLSPLPRLPRLKEIRMRDRHGYKPRVVDLVAAVF
jgi:hypothetical protein